MGRGRPCPPVGDHAEREAFAAAIALLYESVGISSAVDDGVPSAVEGHYREDMSRRGLGPAVARSVSRRLTC